MRKQFAFSPYITHYIRIHMPTPIRRHLHAYIFSFHTFSNTLVFHLPILTHHSSSTPLPMCMPMHVPMCMPVSSFAIFAISQNKSITKLSYATSTFFERFWMGCGYIIGQNDHHAGSNGTLCYSS